ncbi:hypothetical protein FAGKG844_360011 [Frankia sp. AgKG'84/4]
MRWPYCLGVYPRDLAGGLVAAALAVIGTGPAWPARKRARSGSLVASPPPGALPVDGATFPGCDTVNAVQVMWCAVERGIPGFVSTGGRSMVGPVAWRHCSDRHRDTISGPISRYVS